MSLRAANDLNRLLLGSAIGGAIGLVLLALGVAILWNAADQQRTRSATTEAEAAPAVAAGAEPGAVAEAMPYPTVAPGAAAPPVPVEPEPATPPRAATSIWRSLFDTEDEKAEPAAPVAPASRTAPPAAAARPAPRPATPRPSAPRRAPEAQRQEDSLFF